MSLDSSVFLFLALPIILLLYYVLKGKARNIVLFVANLMFYAFGEPIFILLLLFTMAFCFFSAQYIHKNKHSNQKVSKTLFIVSICVNLAPLVFFKYFLFLGEIFNAFLGIFSTSINLSGLKLALPLGISFYTFQAVSYMVDVYKEEVAPSTDFVKFAAYFAFFAQITAGPIVRYKDIETQLDGRELSLNAFSQGLKRFLIGLGQKIILANYFAKIANQLFSLPPNTLGGDVAWIGIIFYTLQIYFDFAGYSSMAIGIAKMFGFSLKENFDHPYTADSVTTFWRKWHISLSSWFRDYIYFPLGGSRKGKVRMYLGLFLVFTLSGIWHGANMTFLVWGVYHAIFIMLEKVPCVKRFSQKLPKLLKHFFTLLIVVVGWVFFRANTITHAFDYIASMCFVNGVGANMPAISPALIVLTVLGIVGSTPLLSWLKDKIDNTGNIYLISTCQILTYIFLLAVFVVCIPIILSGSTTPFIYAQF